MYIAPPGFHMVVEEGFLRVLQPAAAAHVAPLQELPAMLLHLIRQELPLESERASNTESNSRIFRDFLLRVNSDESRGDPSMVAPQFIQDSPESEHIY